MNHPKGIKETYILQKNIKKRTLRKEGGKQRENKENMYPLIIGKQPTVRNL